MTPRGSIRRRAAAVALVSVLVAAVAQGCGVEDGVVGGDCAVGYSACGVGCVDTMTDPSNCGGCGNVCVGIACGEGVCGGSLGDATLGDGSKSDGNGNGDDGAGDEGGNGLKDGSGDGRNGSGEGGRGDDGDNGDDEAGNGSEGGGPPGEGGEGGGNEPDACTPPYDTPQNCGTCGHVCHDPNGLCEAVDGSYACVPTCTPPLVDCGGRCVNLQSDPNNCGMCSNVCPSQYCFDAVCQGTVSGNIMIIGHDFATSAPNDQQSKLLTNSVFYNQPTSIEVLSFEHYSDAATVTNAEGLLMAYANAHSVTLAFTTTTDDTYITSNLSLSKVQAVIIWDQLHAPTGTLAALGAAWATSMSKFAQGGGIVISLDSALGTGEMPAFTTSGGLLAVTGHQAVTAGKPADVPAAGLSIARGMTSVYLVGSHTASFETSEPAAIKLIDVANVQGVPTQLLAVHKVVN